MISEHHSRRDSMDRTSARLDQPWIDRVAAASGDSILLLARILIGGIFVQSGFGKLMGAFATRLARNGIPAAIAPVLARSAPAWNSLAASLSCSGWRRATPQC
jgi:hypothetical protein